MSNSYTRQQDDPVEGNVQAKIPVPRNMLIIGIVGTALVLIDILFLAFPPHSSESFDSIVTVCIGLIGSVITTPVSIYFIHKNHNDVEKYYLVARIGIILTQMLTSSFIVVLDVRRYGFSKMYRENGIRIVYCIAVAVLSAMIVLAGLCFVVRKLFFVVKEILSTYDFCTVGRPQSPSNV